MASLCSNCTRVTALGQPGSLQSFSLLHVGNLSLTVLKVGGRGAGRSEKFNTPPPNQFSIQMDPLFTIEINLSQVWKLQQISPRGCHPMKTQLGGNP